MLKWQENFLAGESVKDPEKIKKKLRRKEGLREKEEEESG